MKFATFTALAAVTLAVPAFAQEGDAEAGKKVFNQCQTCHVVANEAGEVLAGRNAKTGPNLYGVVGRVAGSVPDFKYSESMVAAGQKGLVWDEASLNPYLENPTDYLQAYLEDPKARGKMQFQLRKEEDRLNVIAFLASLAPAPAAGDAAAAPADAAAPAEAPATE